MVGELPFGYQQARFGAKVESRYNRINGNIPDVLDIPGDMTISGADSLGLFPAELKRFQGEYDNLSLTSPGLYDLSEPFNGSFPPFTECFPHRKTSTKTPQNRNELPSEGTEPSSETEEEEPVELVSLVGGLDLAKEKEIKDEVTSIGNIESNHQSIDDRQLKARAEFNISAKNGKPDLELLAPYLAHRQLIKNPEEQKKADQLVLDWANQLDVNMTDSTFKELVDDKAGHIQPADYSTKVNIASQLVTILRNRPDLFDQMKNDKDTRGGFRKVFDWVFHHGDNYDEDKLSILVQTNPENNDGIGGLTSSRNNTILNHKELWITNPMDGRNVILHEFTHLMDASGQPTGDGTLWHMSDKQKDDLKSAREELFKEFKKTGKPPEGFSEYTFTSGEKFNHPDEDFLAETVALFTEHPEALKSASPKLFDTYKDYFKLDPLS